MPNDQYKLGELLGRGGMGQVHIARHRSGRVVAIKRVRNTLATDRLVIDRLSDEARLLRTVSHPNVVRALDHGTSADGMPFLVMDRAYGTPLHQLIAQHGWLPLERTVAIAAQLFAGLSAIHAAQVVHADLKSHNVLVDDVDIVTIIDFGLARALTANPATSGMVAGTPAYMAPEMIAGAHPTVAGDIYALGVVIYEMLTGSTPFTGHISTILTRQLSEPVEPPSVRAPELGISTAIDRVVLRALDPSPMTRYQTVGELAAAFAAALDDRIEPVLAAGSDPDSRPTTERPRVVRPGDHATDRQGDRTSLIISAALTHAQRLIEDHRLAKAVEELEATLAQLAPMLDNEASRSEVWRIETVLAALYDMLGKQERARRMALVAYRHALHTGCPLAEGRAGVLVDRLVARTRRIARGSSGPR
jgi:serine/threonine protein kinase